MGTHIRKVFEPHLYPEAAVLSHYDTVFGDAAFRSQPSSKTGICAYGFEANPKFTHQLQAVEQSYAAMGWRVKFFVPQAVDIVDQKMVNFHVAHDPKHSDWASRVNKTGSSGIATPTLDLPSFLNKAISSRTGKDVGKVIVKMDIETSEYDVLPTMVQKKLLCQGAIDLLLIEWHDRLLYSSADLERAKAVRNQVEGDHPCNSGAITHVVPFDDESYILDGKALPSPETSNQDNSAGAFLALKSQKANVLDIHPHMHQASSNSSASS